MLFSPRAILFSTLFFAIFATASFAQPGNPFEPVFDASWRMEMLTRNDGKRFLGLLFKKTKQDVTFIEIKRQDNKRMHLVTHHYHPKLVSDLRTLPDDEHAKLLKRIQPLLLAKSHEKIEAGRMEDIKLDKRPIGGKKSDQVAMVFQGDWFELESRADEETTRRCVVRVEQVFRAYHRVIPPRQRRDEPLRILLHGSLDSFRDDLHRRQLRIQNPAFFSTQQNMIVAGSELTRYGKQLARIRTKNEAARKDLELRDAQFPQQLSELRGEMKLAGFSNEDITSELRLQNVKWKSDKSAIETKLNAVDRRNEAMFDEVTDKMFRRLFHEAFHAYLENYVFPQGSFNVPRWLNEGMAQIFENSQFDGDTIRIDAPDRSLLELLQADFANERPLAIADLLQTEDPAFLITHDSTASAERHYLYSWGLAYYLVFERNLLGGDRFANYVEIDQAKKSPIIRFEKLVGVPLQAFERDWRNYILALKPAPK